MVRINNRTTKKIEINKRIKQGDVLSAIVFILVLERVIRETAINRVEIIYQRGHQWLVFADNLVILTRSREELRKIIKRVKERWNVGLYINEEKTGWTDKEIRREGHLRIDKENGRLYQFEKTENLTDLGTIIPKKPGFEMRVC